MISEFDQVKEFFEGWGLAPTNEHEDFAVRGASDGEEYFINSACYERMRTEAETLHGREFGRFVSSSVDATDGAFYLTADTWGDLEEAWDEFTANDSD